MSLNGGYAMIKYNSTQEELAIAYKSKKPVLFYDENQRSHWAVIEELEFEDSIGEEVVVVRIYRYKLLNDIKALVDSNGNSRFIGGHGTPEIIDGMTVVSSKWCLNGRSLNFEIMGSFSKNANAYQNMCTFVIPQFISDKIETQIQNLVDISRCELIDTTGDVSGLYFIIYKNDNSITFNLGIPVSTNNNRYFKIRYNIIIDNE